MTSVLSDPKETSGYYTVIAVGPNGLFSTQTILAYSGETGSGANSVPGTFSTAGWAEVAASGAQSTILRGLIGPNTLLKDMGKTVVSSLRTFRKIAAVSTITQNPYATAGNTDATFGVVVDAAGNALTGYIEMGYEGFGAPARVAKFDNL